MNGVVMRSRDDGAVEVIDAPAVAAFSAFLFENAPPFMRGLSRDGDIIRCGDLLRRQFWYRITDYAESSDTYVGELIRVLEPVVV